jgi:hypothetical protein
MFFSRFEYHMFYVLYQFMTYLVILPRIVRVRGRVHIYIYERYENEHKFL